MLAVGEQGHGILFDLKFMHSDGRVERGIEGKDTSYRHEDVEPPIATPISSAKITRTKTNSDAPDQFMGMQLGKEHSLVLIFIIFI